MSALFGTTTLGPIMASVFAIRDLSKSSMIISLPRESSQGLPMPHIQRSTIDALRRCYMKWKEYFCLSASRVSQQQEVQPSLVEQRKVCRDLQRVIGNKASAVELSPNVKALLQDILDIEYLDTNGLYYAKFEDEMMFMSPEKSVAQAFLYTLPCSATLDGIRKCIEDYLEDKTDIINSPDKW